jgi:hypothetical protein
MNAEQWSDSLTGGSGILASRQRLLFLNIVEAFQITFDVPLGGVGA